MSNPDYKKAAQEAIEYVNKYIRIKPSHQNFGKVEQDKRKQLHTFFADVRKETHKSRQKPDLYRGFLATGDLLNRQEQLTENILTKFAVGNCHECAFLAYRYIKTHYPTIKVELIAFFDNLQQISYSHVVTVLGRPDYTDHSNPKTWGATTVICDPWDQSYGSANSFQIMISRTTERMGAFMFDEIPYSPIKHAAEVQYHSSEHFNQVRSLECIVSIIKFILNKAETESFSVQLFQPLQRLHYELYKKLQMLSEPHSMLKNFNKMIEVALSAAQTEVDRAGVRNHWSFIWQQLIPSASISEPISSNTSTSSCT